MLTSEYITLIAFNIVHNRSPNSIERSTTVEYPSSVAILTILYCLNVKLRTYQDWYQNPIFRPYLKQYEKRKNKRKKIDEYYTTTAAGQREKITSADMMRTRLYYPIIDRMLGEMNSRFSPQSNDVMLGVCACSPSSDTFLDIPPLTKLAAHYDLEFSEPEILVAHNFIKSLQSKEEKTFTMEQVHRLLDRDAFPRLKTLFQVALTIPVTSCSCERSFSCLQRVKTWLRTRMT